METTFWMLYAEDESAPTFKHASETDALLEAKRLSMKTGKRIYLLKAISSAIYIDPFSVTTLADDLPF